MKKSLPLLFLVLICFFGCKKDHSSIIKSSEKRYKVSLNVSNFEQQRAEFSLKHQIQSVKHTTSDTVGVSTYLDVLYYYVFDQGGHIVNEIAQDSTMANFGLISDSLQTGTYNVILAAGKSGLGATPGVPGLNISRAYISYGGIDWEDTFFEKFTLEVGTGNLDRDVTLHRIVSKLELNILDAIPDSVSTINMDVWAEFPKYVFDFPNPGGTPDTLHICTRVSTSALGKPGFTFDKIVGNQLALFNITITARDACNHIIAEAHVNNVQSDPNKKTVLSGKLFNNPPASSPQSFTVKIDTAWGATTHISF